MKAIETVYRGYRFRSRLEARWAVFFTALGLRWEYEPEGFDLDEFGWYLPDFYVSDLGDGTWVEVKPNHVEIPMGDVCKWSALVADTGKPLLVAKGTPEIAIYSVFVNPDEFEKERWGNAPVLRDACFSQKYLPPYPHDHTPRLFWMPGSLDDADCHEAVTAARSARFEHGEVPA